MKVESDKKDNKINNLQRVLNSMKLNKCKNKIEVDEDKEEWRRTK